MTRKFTLLMALALAASTLCARNINIHGKITYQGTNDPAAGVTIFDEETNKFLGLTDESGRFSISADSEAILVLSGMSCQEAHEAVNGRPLIDIEVMPEANELMEVTVVAKGGSGLETEPAELDVEGNYLKLKTKVKIPKKLFGSSKRFIIQPAIYNVTREYVAYLTPLVIDGTRYAITQRRMYDRAGVTDTLFTYEQIRTIKGKGEDGTIYIRDSLFVDNPKEDFLCAVFSSLETYNHIIYCDTFEIARGTVNPLRFLQTNLTPLLMEEDEFKPVEEVELRDTDGQMNLLFPVGKAALDMSLGNNADELNTLLADLRVIENDPSMTLKQFNIMGYASPEGREKSNRDLARRRMQSAMDFILGSVDQSLTRNADMTSDADIAPWEDVVSMMRADGLDDEADKMQQVLDRYNTLDARSTAIARLPFYSKTVKGYLPRLRKVSYHIVSSCFRPLTDAEIAELYELNPNTLSRYQFYRYYSAQAGAKREEALRKALEVHPNFVVAATDLAALMLERGENPMDLLEPYFDDGKRKLPMSTYYNMALACMDSAQYARAEVFLEHVPDIESTHKAMIYATALNGKYRNVMQEICEDSPLNEVLILLAMKDNHSAERSARKLGDSAVEEYVKAVVANRLDDYLEATTHLKKALQLDPSLMLVAKVDADVIDLLEQGDFDETDDATDNE